MNRHTEHDSSEGNPYASPVTSLEISPIIEVVHRSRWVWRRYQQTYRFRSRHEPSLLLERAVSFYTEQSAALLSRSESSIEIERIGVRLINQFFRFSETQVPQTITVSVEREETATVVTCCYRVRLFAPDIIVPPYQLETEVRDLAIFCS